MHNTSSGGWESGAANTTAGGYVGSDMYKSNLEQAKTTIKSAFSGHVLKHRIYLTNAVANGRASGGAWCDSEVDLMCEQIETFVRCVLLLDEKSAKQIGKAQGYSLGLGRLK